MTFLGDSNQVPPMTCPYCLVVHDGVTGVAQNGLPSEGALSICAKCSNVSKFDTDLQLVKFSKEEWEALNSDEKDKLMEYRMVSLRATIYMNAKKQMGV